MGAGHCHCLPLMLQLATGSSNSNNSKSTPSGAETMTYRQVSYSLSPLADEKPWACRCSQTSRRS